MPIERPTVIDDPDPDDGTGVGILEVRRALLPVEPAAGQWALSSYDEIVWTHPGRPGRAAAVRRVTAPPHYALGLLTTYSDGRQVTLGTFVYKLQALGLRLQDVERAINES